mmetsp:Transcript_15709/g.23224  ORF Transcript_15709/g.23224 Transcript_15709/m.23224 type:complete len:271 (+) Transcript_15709:387-1199(+)
MQCSLKIHIPLNRDVGSTNAGSINRQVDVRRPGTILPLQIDRLGRDCGCQTAIITERLLPCQTDVTIAGNGGTDLVLVIQLLGDGHALAISAGCEFNAGLIAIVVRDGDLTALILQRVGRLDAERSISSFHALGRLHALDGEGLASDGCDLDAEVIIGIVRVDLEFGAGQILGVDFSTCADSPSTVLGGGFSPVTLGEASDVRGGQCACFEADFEVYVAAGSCGGPAQGGVEAIEATKAAILDRDRKLGLGSIGGSNNGEEGGGGALHDG